MRGARRYDQYQVGFDATWEIDLFGRVRRSVEAAAAETQASVEDSRAVLISTLGDVGRAYIDLRGAQAKRRVVEQNIATERDLLDLARQRRRAGLNTGDRCRQGRRGGVKFGGAAAAARSPDHRGHQSAQQTHEPGAGRAQGRA